jgi:hypothetical protein
MESSREISNPDAGSDGRLGKAQPASRRRRQVGAYGTAMESSREISNPDAG